MTTTTSVFHAFSGNKNASIVSPLFAGVLVLFVFLGLATGYLLAQMKNSVYSSANSSSGSNASKAGTIYGSSDTTTFKDTAEGMLKPGGIKDEGQYHLVRAGGGSQTVYLTSSLVDLSQFTGHTVKVWGQTQKAQYAGWLMDVGRVEVEQ